MRKVSDMSTDEALDFFCEITPYVGNVVSDEELMAELKRKAEKDGAETFVKKIVFVMNKITVLLPLLLKKHRVDIYSVIAACAKTDVEAISRQKFLVTANQVKAMCKDKELVDFFKSCVEQEATE